jgi:hypothetical protein
MNDLGLTTYPAPLGGATLSMTAVASAVLLGVGVLQIVLGLNRTGPQRNVLLVVGSILIVLLFASVLLRIRGYEVTADSIRIRYGFSGSEVALSEITEVSRDRQALSGSTRSAANGGLWSFLGEYTSPTLGDLHVYVSDPSRLVLLKLKKGAVVVSPDDPERFVQEVRSRKGVAR